MKKVATLFATPATANLAASALQASGVEATRFRNMGALIGALRNACFDAVVLEDGDDLPNWLAMLELYSADPLQKIVVGTAGAAGVSRALRHGADDYAPLAEGADSFVARLHARVQSQRNEDEQSQLRVQRYVLDADTHVVKRDGQEITLTAREFALAWMLFVNQGRVVSLNTLSMRVWGRCVEITKRTIEQHIYRLRSKLRKGTPEAGRGLHIQAVYGVGYRLVLEA